MLGEVIKWSFDLFIATVMSVHLNIGQMNRGRFGNFWGGLVSPWVALATAGVGMRPLLVGGAIVFVARMW